MPRRALRLPNSASQPRSHRPSICCSLPHLSSFNESLSFLPVFLFSCSKQKLKCHLCYPFDITWLRYLLAHSFLDYWLHFGWMNSFASARSVILQGPLTPLPFQCSPWHAWWTYRSQRLADFAALPVVFHPPAPPMGNETWAEPSLTV